MTTGSRRVIHCVGTGFIALDIIRSTVDEFTTIERRHAGGTCANVLAILAYFGLRAFAIGRIGADAAGAELLDDLRRHRVDVSFIDEELGQRTPVVFQESLVDARGRARHRFSRTCPACGTTMPGYRPLLATKVSQVARALMPHDIFFFDRVARGPLELARRSRENGALVMFEPSGVKDKNLFAECLRVSHILKYSHERLNGIEALTDEARVPLEIETRGAEGLRFRIHSSDCRHVWRSLPAFSVPTFRDSAGSGDWATAGLLTQIVAGENPITLLRDHTVVSDALSFGQALASINCSYDGARGLAYAMDSSSLLTLATQVLARGVPELRHDRPPRQENPRCKSSCTVCSSKLHTTTA
jgi:fructokinase